MSYDDAELEKRFLYKVAGPIARELHPQVSQLTLELAKKIVRLAPASRQLALALTHLEEVRMWANAAIACNQELLTPDMAPDMELSCS